MYIERFRFVFNKTLNAGFLQHTRYIEVNTVMITVTHLARKVKSAQQIILTSSRIRAGCNPLPTSLYGWRPTSSYARAELINEAITNSIESFDEAARWKKVEVNRTTLLLRPCTILI